MLLGRLFAVLVLLLSAGCASVPKRPVKDVPAHGLVLVEICRRDGITCEWDGLGQTVAVSSRENRVLAMVGSTLAFSGDRQVTLSAPLLLVSGAVIVPPDLEAMLVLSAGKTEVPRWIGRVVLDAGHGGKDPGALGVNKAKEKEIVLDLARKVREGLVRAGIEVTMTRDSDEFISLADRSQAGSRPEVDIFLSIHANAHKNRSARGIEVFFSGPLTATDLADEQRILNGRTMLSSLGMENASADLRRIIFDMLHASKMSASPRLSAAISRHLSGTIPDTHNRGSKPARFFVLRHTLTPAVLIETGFVSNLREARLLTSEAYRRKLAEGIVESVLEFLYDQGL